MESIAEMRQEQKRTVDVLKEYQAEFFDTYGDLLTAAGTRTAKEEEKAAPLRQLISDATTAVMALRQQCIAHRYSEPKDWAGIARQLQGVSTIAEMFGWQEIEVRAMFLAEAALSIGLKIRRNPCA